MKARYKVIGKILSRQKKKKKKKTADIRESLPYWSTNYITALIGHEIEKLTFYRNILQLNSVRLQRETESYGLPNGWALDSSAIYRHDIL